MPRTLPPRRSVSRYGRWLLGAGGALLIFLWAGEIVPALRRPLDAIDASLIRFLNSSLGISRAWDWTAIVFASEAWRHGFRLIIAACAAAEIWAMRRKDFGRAYGFALFCIVAVTLAEELGDEAAEIFERRPAPWLQIQGLVILENLYDSKLLHVLERIRFPDNDFLGWACLCLLLAARLKWTPAFAAAALLVHAFGQAALGMSWPTGMTASASMGAVVAGGGLTLLAGVIRRLEHRAEAMFIARFWRALAGPLRPGAEQAQLARGARRRLKPSEAAKRKRRERVWRRLVEREILPLFPSEAQGFALVNRPPGDADARWKFSPYVRFLVLPESEIFVVKMARNFWGLAHRSEVVGGIRAAAQNALALTRLGFPTPQIHWTVEGIERFGAVRYFMTVEEFLPSRAINSENESEICDGMRLLARLHAVDRAEWGLLAELEPRAPEEYVWAGLRARVQAMIKRLARNHPQDWPEDAEARIWRLFEGDALALAARADHAFRLCHGDASVRNIRMSERGIVMIDFPEVGYDWAGWEIMKAALSFSHRNGGRAAAAWQAYFRAAGEARWNEFRREGRLALAFQALREAAHGRAFLRAEHRPAFSGEDWVEWLESLAGRAPELWGKRPEDSDWEMIVRLIYYSPDAAGARSDADGPGGGL